MIVTLTSTSKVVTLDGVDCRIWEGVTSKGIPCHAFIPRIAGRSDDDALEFDADLKEQAKPTPEVDAYPRCLIL